jgi:mono/diheme cytochrome c family protein
MWARSRIAAACFFLAMGSSACASDWRTDMWYQPSLRPQQAPRPEPVGSVPLQGLIVADEREDLDGLQNPVPKDTASIARGKRLYAGRCTACHGDEGRGHGPMAKVFPDAPDLASTQIRGRSDAFIFATFTLGGRAMPPQNEGLTIHDRWDLVNYVRDIQARTPIEAPAEADGGQP